MSETTETQAVFERDDERTVWEQIHGRYHVEPDGDDYKRIPDINGNVSLCVRAHELAEWLLNGPDAAVVLDTGDGPEGGDSVLFEWTTAYDDPDPYDVIVVRTLPRRVR